MEEEEESDDEDKRKDKKLVFLSRSVLQQVRQRPMVTGTQIANEILEMYKQFCDVSYQSHTSSLAGPEISPPLRGLSWPDTIFWLLFGAFSCNGGCV